MQEETLREKQAVQLRLQSAVDMQAALEKSFEAKVVSVHCVISKPAALHSVEPDHGLKDVILEYTYHLKIWQPETVRLQATKIGGHGQVEAKLLSML